MSPTNPTEQTEGHTTPPQADIVDRMETSLSVLLTTLTSALASASASAPSSDLLRPPTSGISLLDTKNELLLSYLHNLVFLILVKLRHAREGPDDEDASIEDEVVKDLVELRVYLEKGVRPLEGRLKYQIDKVLRAADDHTVRPIKQNKPPGDDAASGSSSPSRSSASPPPPPATAEISDLSYRPNPSSLLRPTKSSASTGPSAATSTSSSTIYRPPRITPTSLPNTKPSPTSRAPRKSSTLAEFLATEASAAPLAEPSIGTTISSLGRRTASTAERASRAERARYEEENFVRLPKEARKKKGGKRSGERERGGGMGGYGGEDWTGLGRGAERIAQLTRSRGGIGGGKAALERSRKRALDGDGDGGSGGRAGKRRG
ncbi:MAG: hypothetical protein M1832_005541 [Thelocarpon impressellum]|nr:MAG: hypothetical protein M1832_005541 [Thelocarpon impressellum]